MSNNKNNGDIIPFLKQKDYIMVNNDLGGGSFGKTVLLQDPFIDELFVAKKYAPKKKQIKEKFYKNFLDEIKILYKLNHRNIVRVYNYYAYENIHTGYILMEYVKGTDIGTFINNYFPPLESVSIDSLFTQLIDAFCYIEEHGIIHRDIRESNILVDDDGIIKVIDFGIGKIFEETDKSEDSLMFQINRQNAGALPDEHYQGKYSSLTDMFYLAELFQRLLLNSKHYEDFSFSYMDIVEKMMQKSPDDRYSSFSEIRNAIGKHDFINSVEISDEDKEIYQDFVNLIYRSITSYTSEPKFNKNIDSFVAKLQDTLKINMFESIIQKNADVINSIVLSGYRYNNTIDIECDVVKTFLAWFISSTAESQDLILSNIIAKLSLKRIEEEDQELPF